MCIRDRDRGFSVLGIFKLDHLHPIKPLLSWKFSNFFTFILVGQFLLPQRANNGKRDFFQPKKWMRQGFQCLLHSNRTICFPLNPFWSENFPTFSPSYWEANSYYPRGPIMGKGNSSNFKFEWDRGFSVPGAFKLDHLHPIKPLLLQKFSIFFTFILGGQFFLPQRANDGKREFFQLQNWMRQRLFGAWGIQTGPSASH